MMERSSGLRYDEWRLVVIDAQSLRLLAHDGASGAFLPREFIAPYTRVAEALTEAIKQHYGLSTIQLAVVSHPGERGGCAVHEVISSCTAACRPLSLLALDEIASGELTAEERNAVLSIMAGEPTKWGRFARLGWIYELLDLMGTNRDRIAMPVIRQLGLSIDFCLISWKDASGRKLWFKAVGEPNTREYRLTLALAGRFRAYLPKITVSIPEWNGWVMEDANGVPLNESHASEQCKEALTALAVMQREMACDVHLLRTVGAKDWTCLKIAALCEPFFADAERIMLAQISTKTNPLLDSELILLRSEIESAISIIENAGIPETLFHGDIGHGNIIATSEGPVFLDWAETYIGHPFLCAEHLLADFMRFHPHLSCDSMALRIAYANHWKDYATTSALTNVVTFAPATAAFVYALMAWESSVNGPEPTRSWPLIRSLLRRTKWELVRARSVAA